MKTIQPLTLAAAIGLLAVGYPSVAKNDIDTLTPSSSWRLEQMPDRCQLTRLFGTGDERMRMTIEKGGPDPTFNLTLIGDRVKNPYGPIVSIQFGSAETAFGRTYITAETSTGKPVIVLYGASFSASLPSDDGSYTIEKPDAARFAAMDFLQVGRAGLKPFRMDFAGSLMEPMADMAQCTQALKGALSVASTGQSQPPEPASNPGRWMLPKDYPPMMLNYRKEGRVQFRLTVDDAGKPKFCAIEKTSLPQMFDDAVCLAMMRNAEFEPALGWDGKPTPSYWRSRIKFRLR